MITYTQKEVDDFIEELDCTTDSYNEIVMYITYKGNSCLIPRKVILSILFPNYGYYCSEVVVSEYGVDSDVHLELLKLKKFIYEVPFDEVPLYVNVYSNFANWRLRIGK